MQPRRVSAFNVCGRDGHVRGGQMAYAPALGAMLRAIVDVVALVAGSSSVPMVGRGPCRDAGVVVGANAGVDDWSLLRRLWLT